MPDQDNNKRNHAAHGVGVNPPRDDDRPFIDPIIDLGKGLIAAIGAATEALDRLASTRQNDSLPAPMGGFATVGGLEPMRPSDVYAAAMRAQNQYDAASPAAWREQLPVIASDMEKLGINVDVIRNEGGCIDRLAAQFKGLSIYVDLAPTPRPNPAEPLTLAISSTDGTVFLRSHTTSHAGLLQTLRGFIAGLQAQQPVAVDG